MAKLTRKNQKVFGSSAGPTQIGKFGSLAAGLPEYTSDPEQVQSLSQYLDGWFSGVLLNNSPAMQDMNALCFLFAYQLAYLMQTGVAEWNAETTYYIGSLVSDGVGSIYYSRTDTNLNHALSVDTYWSKITGPATIVSSAANAPVSINAGLIRVSVTHTETMPPAASVLGKVFTFKKTDSNASTVTIAFDGVESADGQTTLSLIEQYSFVSLMARTGGYDIVSAG